jgi:peptidoglycan/xylan/chitin deacetylase (PgdA/CDA1 family)
MGRVMVLMYHALYGDTAELAGIDPADRPYAVSLHAFRAQLDWLAAAGIPVCDPCAPQDRSKQDGVRVVLTFDDGHASNFHHAYPMLRERGIVGVFFVTTDFIGLRPGFCAWQQLQEMVAGGMRVGSHGKTHRFLDDLDREEAGFEMAASRDAIANGVGQAPTLLSFPGGRYRSDLLPLGRGAGYELFFSSDAGANRTAALKPGALLRRMAIRDDTEMVAFAGIAGAAPLTLARARAVGAMKTALRRIVGNRLYHALYERIST